MARTIDNLGMDSSTRYAEDRANYDDMFGRDAVYVPSQALVTSTSPHNPLEFDTLFNLGEKGISWAAFKSPLNFSAIRRRIFAEQIIPKLGSPEKREAQVQRLIAFGNQEQMRHPKEGAKIGKEKESLLSLFSTLGNFDQLLFDINSRIAEYKKG